MKKKRICKRAEAHALVCTAQPLSAASCGLGPVERIVPAREMATNRLAGGARAATAQGNSEEGDREEGRVSLRAAANVVMATNRVSGGERASTTEL